MMKHVWLRFFSSFILITFIGFIIFIHMSSLKPSFSILKDNNLSNLKEGELIYYGSSSCDACQEFNKVLKNYQDETQKIIYYWDANDFAIVRKAAEIKVYSTPSIIMKRGNEVEIIRGYKNIEELKLSLEED